MWTINCGEQEKKTNYFGNTPTSYTENWRQFPHTLISIDCDGDDEWISNGRGLPEAQVGGGVGRLGWMTQAAWRTNVTSRTPHEKIICVFHYRNLLVQTTALNNNSISVFRIWEDKGRNLYESHRGRRCQYGVSVTTPRLLIADEFQSARKCLFFKLFLAGILKTHFSYLLCQFFSLLMCVYGWEETGGEGRGRRTTEDDDRVFFILIILMLGGLNDRP